ncbi:MAG: hypothetical protein J6Y35_07240 [Bacteroidales bacterium]|nr:hypothetical protein [Bacteroidales bacterium]
MKKINLSIITLLVIAMTIVFASCTKDGIYKPKKKISKIYETVQTDPNPTKELKETWTWNGKLLSMIDYGDGEFAKFLYTKKQLSSIEGMDSRIEVNYDEKGKYIDNFKVYSDNELRATYTFEHGDKHLLTGYTIEYEGGLFNRNSARLVENVFRFLAPEIASEGADEYVQIATSNLKGKEKYTVTLTYDGKNVIEKVVNNGDEKYTYTYTYTEYLNPFYGLLDINVDNFISKNAVSSCVITRPNLPDYNYTYTYQVDGKVPTQMTENMTWALNLGNTTTTHTETITTDYEFTK